MVGTTQEPTKELKKQVDFGAKETKTFLDTAAETASSTAESLGEMAETARDNVMTATGMKKKEPTMSEKAQDLAGDVKDTVTDKSTEVKQKSTDLFRDAQQKGSEAVETAKEKSEELKDKAANSTTPQSPGMLETAKDKFVELGTAAKDAIMGPPTTAP